MNPRICLPLALLSLMCAACQSSFSELPVSSAPLTSNPQNPETQAQPSSPSVQIATGSLPAPQTYDLQVNDNQIVMRLTQVSFAEDSIIVNLAITNGTREITHLNFQDDMVLRDDVKHRYGGVNQYNLAVPPENPKIEIQPGTTLKGQFVFIGRLATKATFLSLNTNTKSYRSEPRHPRMVINDILVKR